MGGRATKATKERRQVQRDAATALTAVARTNVRHIQKVAAEPGAVVLHGGQRTALINAGGAGGADVDALMRAAEHQLDRGGMRFTKADYVQALFIVSALVAQRDGGEVSATFHRDMSRLTVESLIQVLRARLYNPATLRCKAVPAAPPGAATYSTLPPAQSPSQQTDKGDRRTHDPAPCFD